MRSIESSRARHLVLRAERDEVLPDALHEALRDAVVLCGWLRASGVLTEVELRALRADLSAHAPARRIAGPVQALAIEGSIGTADGEPTVSLRAVLARETDRGLETIAGEIVSARVIALEALVTALDDVSLERVLDGHAGVWMLDVAETGAAPPEKRVARAAASAAAAAEARPAARENTAWADAISASVDADREVTPRRAAPGAVPTVGGGGPPIPPRPARPSVDFDQVLPDAGDSVEHFAFGTCDVLKSDGDRLHLRMHKDGRIKEIAIDMLKVTPLGETEAGRRRFRLDRKL